MARATIDDFRRILFEVWSETLGLDDIDADDSFFDLGGDSVEAVSAALEIEKRAGIALSLTDFAYQSFDQLVRLYGESLSAAERERP